MAKEKNGQHKAAAKPARRPSRWLVAQLRGKGDLVEPSVFQAGTAQQAVDDYVADLSLDGDDLVLRVYPMRANGDALDYQLTTVPKALAMASAG